jgi:hypothetical protein
MRSNMKIGPLLKTTFSAAFLAYASLAQAQTGTVTNHAFALGKGPGITGYTSLLCTSAQLAVGQAAADPVCQTITGDVTISAGGVTAIGSSKVTNAMLSTMAANTTRCNATAGTANPTDCTAATMRTNLALVPGTNVQAWDADLDCLAALATTGIIRRTGAGTCSAGTAVNLASEVSGNLPNANLATMATNTVKGNATASTATPTDLAVPSCSTASSALTWTTSSGFGCNTIAGSTQIVTAPQGRITLTSGTAVPTADVSGATTVYYTPAVGRFVPIYNLSQFVMTDMLAELSQATTDATKSPAAIVSGSLYDIFVWNDSGTIRATRGPSWTAGAVAGSSTVRGTGAGSTELQFINGIPVNKNAITNGPAATLGTYVGTIRSGATASIDLKFGTAAAGGGGATLGVWNAYNQAPVVAIVRDTTSSWNYQSATARFADGSANNTVSFVKGLAVDPIDVTYQCRVNYTAAANSNAQIGIGMDVTGYDFAANFVSQSSGVSQTLVSVGSYKPVLGGHFVAAVENTDATNNNQFVSLSLYQYLKYSSFY